MRYMVVIEEGPTSLGAYVPDLPGCIAVGESAEEVLQLIQEAIEFHIDQGRTASYPTAPSQIPACGITAPGSSELLTSHIFAAQVFLEIMAYPRFD